jgi:pyruvate dehydrogenase (quinone)
VTWEQRAMEGDPKFEDSQDVPDFPYAKYAEMLGLRGIRCDRSEDVALSWDLALESAVPCVLEMVTDPDVPPLPPHISVKQAKAYASALFHGDPNSIGIITASIKEVWDGLFPSDSGGTKG